MAVWQFSFELVPEHARVKSDVDFAIAEERRSRERGWRYPLGAVALQ